MTSIGSVNCLVLDFETTGRVGAWPNEPWQVGMIAVQGGRPVPATCFETLFCVGERPVNPHAPGLFHVRRPEIKAAPEWNSFLPQLCRQLQGTTLAAHNVSTERNILRDKAPLHRFGPWIDTLKLTRGAYPGLPSYKLEYLTDKLELTTAAEKLCPGREAHDALYDAVCCALLLCHLAHLPQWKNAPLERIVIT